MGHSDQSQYIYRGRAVQGDYIRCEHREAGITRGQSSRTLATTNDICNF